MRVRASHVSDPGLRPGSVHVCVVDRKDGHECWFDVGKDGVGKDGVHAGGVGVTPANHDQAAKLLFVRFPEEADNGRYGAWISYDDIVGDKPPFILHAIVLDRAEEAVRWIRENWRSGRHGPLPGELQQLVNVVAEAQAASASDI